MENFTARAGEVENAPLWAHLLSWFLAGHSRASPKPRQGIVPSFFCREYDKGKRKKWQQERQKSWLRKDCAETAIGSRKENASAPAYGRSRTTWNACAAPMAFDIFTKLTDGSEWYKLLTTRQRTAPSFFCRNWNKGRGKMRDGKSHK